MPEDNADLGTLLVEFPRLDPDTASSCPVLLEELLDYLSDEVPGGERLRPDDLRFLRTAQVADQRYWIWSFSEPDGGDLAYATVALGPGGTQTVGYETDYYGLTPEQFMLGDYHNVF
jgi:hypothetical protein